MKKQFAFLMVPAVAVAISSTASADLLYDNGGPDGTNGYSNILGAGLDRRVADDFILPEGPGFFVDNVEINYVWGTVGVPGTATEFLVQIFLDDVGGGPGTLVSSQVSNSFTATETGNVFFSRAEFIFSVDLTPVALAGGTSYYLSIQPNGDDNGFQLTSHVPHQNGEDTYVNYVDLTGGLWQSAQKQFDADSDMVFRVNGELKPDGDPCDTNCDGVVDAFDIEPFLDLIYDFIEPCAPGAGDVNGDGVVDAFDIEPFITCLFGGSEGGGSAPGRLYFDLAGNVGNSGQHPGSTAKENPMLVDDGRLFIYWEFGGPNQRVYSPNYDIEVDGGTIVTAWNYQNPNVGGLFGPRWDVVDPSNAPIGGPFVSFISASITTFGLGNDIVFQTFDGQHSLNDGPNGSTLLGFVDVTLDAGQSSATVWITVGQEGIAIEGGNQQTPMSFGFDDDPVGAGDIGDRTRIAEATIITKQAEGACCLAADDCVILTEVDCLAEDGKYLGDGTTCEDDPCQSDCPWDLVEDGEVGLADLLKLLEFWGNPYGLAELLDLLAAWGPCPDDPIKSVYSHEFIGGVTYCPGDPQYDDWLSFRASLPNSGVSSITVSGSLDPTGRTCDADNIAQQIANAMRTQTPLTVECGGFTWTVNGTCQTGCGLPDNDLELSAGGGGCPCDATHNVRPGIGNSNWGGIIGGNCGSPTQIMTVTIE